MLTEHYLHRVTHETGGNIKCFSREESSALETIFSELNSSFYWSFLMIQIGHQHKASTSRSVSLPVQIYSNYM